MQQGVSETEARAERGVGDRCSSQLIHWWKWNGSKWYWI